jgi:photosystem II stability/assembly factor-like uncharacterized protein
MGNGLRRRGVLVTALFAALVVGVGCGDGGENGDGQALEHIHGLGVNPADGALYIATHHGLFRAARGERTPSRVGESEQDIMGFAVVGPNRFIGSGHPAPGENAPPNLGLISSTDAGRSWRGVSLAGEADFHVLRAANGIIYGFNGPTGLLMVSTNGGRAWTEREPPAPLFDLAIDPDDPKRIVAASEAGLLASSNGGARWRTLNKSLAGLLSWPARGRLYLIDVAGDVRLSTDGGRRWRQRGSIGAPPVAFSAGAPGELLAATEDGAVQSSRNGGANWNVRLGP